MQIRTFVVLLTLSGTLALAQTTSPAPQPSQTPTSSAPGSDTPSTDQKPTDTKPDTKPDTKTETKKDQKQDAAAAAPMPAAEPGESLDPSIKKGTEEDVSAVGQRSIGSRGMGNWYSTNWEIGTGKQYSVEIERSSHLVTDPVVVEYVNRVGQNDQGAGYRRDQRDGASGRLLLRELGADSRLRFRRRARRRDGA
jgi:hypothetical protein